MAASSFPSPRLKNNPVTDYSSRIPYSSKVVGFFGVSGYTINPKPEALFFSAFQRPGVRGFVRGFRGLGFRGAWHSSRV